MSKIEEDAHKVMGRIRNKTEDRRFAFITIEVSLFLGDELVETTTCNIGSVILKPGESATFSGYIYSDPMPEHDQIESRVSQFEEMD